MFPRQWHTIKRFDHTIEHRFLIIAFIHHWERKPNYVIWTLSSLLILFQVSIYKTHWTRWNTRLLNQQEKFLSQLKKNCWFFFLSNNFQKKIKNRFTSFKNFSFTFHLPIWLRALSVFVSRIGIFVEIFIYSYVREASWKLGVAILCILEEIKIRLPRF